MTQKLKVLLLLSLPLALEGSIRFGSRESMIQINSGASLLLTQTITLAGTVTQNTSSSILGQSLIFNAGTYASGIASLDLTGTYQPDVSGTGTIILQGSLANPNYFRADPGMQIGYFKAMGDYNRIAGFPQFGQSVTLADATTTLTIAIKSALNKDILFNGGRIILEDDLQLADGVSLQGTGTILLNGHRMIFGAQNLKMTSSIYWIGAADLYLFGKIDLSASWTFVQNCYFNSDSTQIKLVPGGNITIRNNSALIIRQVQIAGIGGGPREGKIYFEDGAEPSTSELHLQRSALELTSTYTVNRGNIIVEGGSSKIVTYDNTLYFVKPGRLTVNNVDLYYRTRTYADASNITPTYYNQINSAIVINGNGDIQHYGTFDSFQQRASTFNEGFLNQNVYLGTGSKTTWQIESASPVVDGQGWYYHFARGVANLLIVDGNTQAKLTNLVLKDFCPHHVALLAGASLTFQDKVTIELGSDIPDPALTSNTVTWTFQGNCTIDGKGKVVSTDLLHLKVQDYNGNPSQLTLQDMILELYDGGINIQSNQSEVIFKDVTIILNEDVNFPRGFFEINGAVKVYSGVTTNDVKFVYSTDCSIPSKINQGSSLYFDRNVTFSYAPTFNSNSLLSLQTKSSEVAFHGATLYNSRAGLAFTTGAVVIDGKFTVSNEAVSLSGALVFGDGININNDPTVEVLPGGSIIKKGWVEYLFVGQ